MRPPRRRLAVALVVLALAGCACGVPTSGSPRALGQNDVPQLAPTTTTAPAALSDLPFTVVWLTSSNATAALVRYAPEQANRLANALNVLLEGPPAAYFTAIPIATRLNGVTPNAAVGQASVQSEPITVDLSNSFQESSGLDELLAVEQVVFTIACNLPQAVPHLLISFEVDGNPLQVPVLNNTTVARPVTPADYQFTSASCMPVG